MNQYLAKNIINLAVAGHGGAGKTSLAEAMLYLAGVSDRRGKVGDGNTVCDYDPEEIRQGLYFCGGGPPGVEKQEDQPAGRPRPVRL